MLFLTTKQISKLFFNSSRWTANKRMRMLLDAGLVRVWVRALAQDNIYSLDSAGAKALRKNEQDNANERFADEMQEKYPTPKGLDGNIDHLLAINSVRIAIALGLPALGAELVWWRSDWELRAASRAGIISDALFLIRWPDTERRFALELDNNTRSVKSFLKKMLRYQAMAGNAELCVLMVGRDARWLERYRQALMQTNLDIKVFFTTLNLIDNCCTADVWISANGIRYSLQNIAYVPNGKENECAASHRNEGASPNGSSSYIPDLKGSFCNR